jgi:5-methylcytosine-specific restriction endonuclease McrA
MAKDKSAEAKQLDRIDADIANADAVVGQYYKNANQRRQRRNLNSRSYTMREMSEAVQNHLDGKIARRGHYDAVLRFGTSIVSAAFLFSIALNVILGGRLIQMSYVMQDRPVYLRDQKGFTTRLLLDKNTRQEQYIRDQIDEYVGNVLTCLYTYNPEGQPRIDLLIDLVEPEIIKKEKKEFQDHLQNITTSRELRTVEVNNVEVKSYDKDRGFAVVHATGDLIYNNVNESTSVPISWDILLEIKPNIQSGPNVYGMVLKQLDEIATKPE